MATTQGSIPNITAQMPRVHFKGDIIEDESESHRQDDLAYLKEENSTLRKKLRKKRMAIAEQNSYIKEVQAYIKELAKEYEYLYIKNVQTKRDDEDAHAVQDQRRELNNRLRLWQETNGADSFSDILTGSLKSYTS